MIAKGKKVFAIFFLLLITLGFVHLLMPITNGQNDKLVADNVYWLRIAQNAWKYFQPGVGVDSKTGLHSAGLGYPYFTDWDLGVYLQAIIDANQLGILSNSGSWGANARINYVLTFLGNRPLNSNGVPYVWYQSSTGNAHTSDQQNACDAGQLLVALNNLRMFRPDLAATINSIVYNRTNYGPLQQAIDSLSNSKNIYDYYVASGFAGFWPSRFTPLADSILYNILSAPTVSVYGSKLPIAKLTCDPLFLSVFNLPNNSRLNGIVEQVYSAHEAKYKATGKFVAYSEGNTDLDNPSYVYEWVVKEDGSTWTIDNDRQARAGISPIIFFKSAVSLLAIHSTSYTLSMASYIESQLPNPSSGYADGIDENGRINNARIDKTNGMIIAAALFATTNPQDMNPSRSQTPTSNPSSTSKSTPLPSNSKVSPTISPTASPMNPNPSLNNSIEPTTEPNSASSSPTSANSSNPPDSDYSRSSASPNSLATSSPSPNGSISRTPNTTGEYSSPTAFPQNNQPLNWYVIVFIAVFLVLVCAGVAQGVTIIKRKTYRRYLNR